MLAITPDSYISQKLGNAGEIAHKHSGARSNSSNLFSAAQCRPHVSARLKRTDVRPSAAGPRSMRGTYVCLWRGTRVRREIAITLCTRGAPRAGKPRQMFLRGTPAAGGGDFKAAPGRIENSTGNNGIQRSVFRIPCSGSRFEPGVPHSSVPVVRALSIPAEKRKRAVARRTSPRAETSGRREGGEGEPGRAGKVSRGWRRELAREVKTKKLTLRRALEFAEVESSAVVSAITKM